MSLGEDTRSFFTNSWLLQRKQTEMMMRRRRRRKKKRTMQSVHWLLLHMNCTSSPYYPRIPYAFLPTLLRLRMIKAAIDASKVNLPLEEKRERKERKRQTDRQTDREREMTASLPAWTSAAASVSWYRPLSGIILYSECTGRPTPTWPPTRRPRQDILAAHWLTFLADVMKVSAAGLLHRRGRRRKK